MKLKNLNFTLPEGTTNHGDPHLLCFPTRWNDIAVFIVVNFVAHAATIKTPPASSPCVTAWYMLGALLVPSTGLALGMSTFYQAWKGFKQPSLRKATLAQALCMYVRADDWYNKSCPSIRTLQIKATVNTSPFDEVRLINRAWRLLYVVSRKGSSLLWSLPALFRLYLSLSFDLTARHVFYMMKATDNIHGKQSERMQPVSEDVLIWDRYVGEHLYMPNLSPIVSSPNTVVGQSGSQQPIETAVIYTTKASNIVNPGSKVYGQCPSETEGYLLAHVPMNSIVEPVAEPCDGLRTLELLSEKRNATKSLLAFVQLCFSVFVLVQARGNQVDLYGLAAFSLSVAPYAVMAAVNLLANAIVPEYDCLFLVENDVMQEMRLLYGHQFHGIVGKVLEKKEGDAVTLHLPGKEDGGQKWVSGIPGLQQDARLRLLTPDEAISDGILPDICITTSATHETERQGSLFVDQPSFITVITLLVGYAPLAISAGMSRLRFLTEPELPTKQKVTQMLLLFWLLFQQSLGLIISSNVFLAQGKAAVPAPILRKFWSNSNRLLTPELFHRLGFDPRVYGLLHHRVIRLLYRLWIHANTFPLRLLTLLRYPFASGNPFLTTLFFVCFAPAIWGLVHAGKLLKEYGNCVRVY